MVQLKVVITSHSQHHFFCFNSYMVQLKDVSSVIIPSIFKMFQFLHGTIKRLPMYRTSWRDGCFNSYMVQLKENICSHGWTVFTCFNSYMVQLKVRIWNDDDLWALFQFLHGTIKSLTIATNRLRTSVFQFLHGTIKRPESIADRCTKSQFQFLHGTIKRSEWELYFTSVEEFQFLHGTIKRVKELVDLPVG